MTIRSLSFSKSTYLSHISQAKKILFPKSPHIEAWLRTCQKQKLAIWVSPTCPYLMYLLLQSNQRFPTSGPQTGTLTQYRDVYHIGTLTQYQTQTRTGTATARYAQYATRCGTGLQTGLGSRIRVVVPVASQRLVCVRYHVLLQQYHNCVVSDSFEPCS